MHLQEREMQDVLERNVRCLALLKNKRSAEGIQGKQELSQMSPAHHGFASSTLSCNSDDME